MARHTLGSIYRKELDKLLDVGLPEKDAELEAAMRAEDIYWDMVDAGRQAAKDKEWD